MGHEQSHLSSADFVELGPGAYRIINQLRTANLRQAAEAFCKAWFAYKRKGTRDRLHNMFDSVQDFEEAILADCRPNDPLRINFCKFADEFLAFAHRGTRKRAMAEQCLDHIGSNIGNWAMRHHNFVRKCNGQPPIDFDKMRQQSHQPRRVAPRARPAPRPVQQQQAQVVNKFYINQSCSPCREPRRQPVRNQQSRARPAQRPRQGRRHACGLVRFKTQRAGWRCNVCKVVVPAGCDMFGCRQCNYDECPMCFARGNSFLRKAPGARMRGPSPMRRNGRSPSPMRNGRRQQARRW